MLFSPSESIIEKLAPSESPLRIKGILPLKLTNIRLNQIKGISSK